MRLAATVAGAASLLAAVYMFTASGPAGSAGEAERLLSEARYDEAIAVARSVDRRPASARAQAVEAQALIRSGRLREAVTALEAIARRQPGDWSVHRDLWAVYSSLGEDGRAREALQRALALNPGLLNAPQPR